MYHENGLLKVMTEQVKSGIQSAEAGDKQSLAQLVETRSSCTQW